ncbi:Hypothetical protein RAK1035_2826 [Roseovarius sp. AK1035]|nr:Hypothetical protein RAK1035_2826 [Roseovarius sp. AK1035]
MVFEYILSFILSCPEINKGRVSLFPRNRRNLRLIHADKQV